MGSLHQQRAEGELVLEQNDGTRRLYWANGDLKYLRSDAVGEQFGNFLIRRGVLDMASLKELLPGGRPSRAVGPDDGGGAGRAPARAPGFGAPPRHGAPDPEDDLDPRRPRHEPQRRSAVPPGPPLAGLGHLPERQDRSGAGGDVPQRAGLALEGPAQPAGGPQQPAPDADARLRALPPGHRAAGLRDHRLPDGTPPGAGRQAGGHALGPGRTGSRAGRAAPPAEGGAAAGAFRMECVDRAALEGRNRSRSS